MKKENFTKYAGLNWEIMRLHVPGSPYDSKTVRGAYDLGFIVTGHVPKQRGGSEQQECARRCGSPATMLRAR